MCRFMCKSRVQRGDKKTFTKKTFVLFAVLCSIQGIHKTEIYSPASEKLVIGVIATREASLAVYTLFIINSATCS